MFEGTFEVSIESGEVLGDEFGAFVQYRVQGKVERVEYGMGSTEEAAVQNAFADLLPKLRPVNPSNDPHFFTHR